MSAVILDVGATRAAFRLFAAALPWLGIGPALPGHMLRATLLAAIFLVGSLMAVAAISLAMVVSSRVTDPRVAEQFTVVLVLPALAVLFAKLAGWMVINLAAVITSAQFLLLVDAALISLGVHLF